MREFRKIPGFNLAVAVFAAGALVVLFTHKLPDGVYSTYATAAKNLANHVDPYPKSEFDFPVGYKYSPLFAVLFYPFQTLPAKLGPFLWRSLNLAAFMAGLGVFLTALYERKGGVAALLDRPYKLVILLTLVFTEMGISLKAGQANPMVCGSMLWALARYSRGRYRAAGIVLAFVSNFKIYPLALALLLLWDFKPQYWKAFFATYVLALFLPVAVLGWAWNQEMALAWHKTLFSDFHTESKLSLMAFLQANFGFDWSAPYRVFIVLNIALLCAGYRYALSALGAGGAKLLYPLVALFILLFNHRTETELFILIDPVYAILFLDILEKRAEGKSAAKEIGFFALGYFFVTLVYTDLTPDRVGELFSAAKSRILGALILYVYFLDAAFREARAKLKRLAS